MTLNLPFSMTSRARLRLSAWLLGGLLTGLLPWTGHAATPAHFNTRFVTVAFHDAADRLSDVPPEQRGDAVSTERLVAFLDWLRGNDWTAITLDDVEAARAGLRPLPERAILITVDDGYKSFYTHFYPLALAYRMPMVAAIHTKWLESDDPEALVQYGLDKVPRKRFLTWAQMREMQASGLIEFASHSHGMPSGVKMAPQGSTAPAAVIRAWTPPGGHESLAAHRERLRQDLRTSSDIMARELGRRPRAIAWPFGAHTVEAREASRAAGLPLMLTLDPEPSDARRPQALARYLPVNDPRLGEMLDAMAFTDPMSSARRLSCMNPAELLAHAPGQPPEQALEATLGDAIERASRLTLTHVVVPAVSPEGRAWFPNEAGVPYDNVLPRLARQLLTRGGAKVVVVLPVAQALALTGGDRARALQLYRDLGAFVRPDGLWLTPEDGAAAWVDRDAPRDPRYPWLVRADRAALDPAGLSPEAAFSLQVWRSVQAFQETLALVWRAPADTGRSAPLADLTLVPADVQGRSPGWRPPAAPGGRSESRRIGLWWQAGQPVSDAALTEAFRAMARAGGTVFGWCPDGTLTHQPAEWQITPELGTRAWLPE